MSSITVLDPPRRGLDKMIGKTFKLSRLLFTFPFYVSNDNLHVSYKFFFISLIVIGYISTVSILFAKDLYRTIPDPKVIKFSFYTPICFTMIPICNLGWLLYKKNKIVDFFKILREVEVETGYGTPSSYPKMVIATSILLIGTSAVTCTFVKLYIFGECIINLCVIIAVSILEQFLCLINMVKHQYRHILDSLDHGNVEKWCSCREELGKCCVALSDCYAPQLLLVITTNFVTLVCAAYQFAVSAVIHSDVLIGIIYAVWAALQLFITWYIIFMCDSTLSFAKKFDNLVYYMIINDSTKTLVKNKRIVIHFKANRKEEFSAMGFFNLDYPLLCSMVSSATTYIVILMQFS